MFHLGTWMNILLRLYTSESGLAILTIKDEFKLYWAYVYSNSKELFIEKDYIYKSNVGTESQEART